jgi:hypothetical protein
MADRTDVVLDRVQDGLDVASMAMDGTAVGAAVSWAPDLLNAGISLSRGDREGAALSAAAAIPGVGNIANATRLSRSAAKSATNVTNAGKATTGTLERNVRHSGKQRRRITLRSTAQTIWRKWRRVTRPPVPMDTRWNCTMSTEHQRAA